MMSGHSRRCCMVWEDLGGIQDDLGQCRKISGEFERFGRLKRMWGDLGRFSAIWGELDEF